MENIALEARCIATPVVLPLLTASPLLVEHHVKEPHIGPCLDPGLNTHWMHSCNTRAVAALSHFKKSVLFSTCQCLQRMVCSK